LTQYGRNKPHKLIYREGEGIKVDELKGSRELAQKESVVVIRLGMISAGP